MLDLDILDLDMADLAITDLDMLDFVGLSLILAGGCDAERGSSSSSSCGRFLLSTSFCVGLVCLPAFVFAGGFSTGAEGVDCVILSLTLRAPSVGVGAPGVVVEGGALALVLALVLALASATKDEDRLTLILSRGFGGGADSAPGSGADMLATGRVS